MGEEKALIDLAGEPLLKRTADRLAVFFSDVIVVADAPERFRDLPYRFEADDQSGLGPMGGLATALRTAEKETLFVVACDMPFLNPNVIRSMIDHLNGYDLLMPNLGNRLHPLHALYTKKCLPVIEAQIKAGDLALHHLVDAVNSRLYPEEMFRQFDPSLRSVMNINTPAELERARQLIEEEKDGLC